MQSKRGRTGTGQHRTPPARAQSCLAAPGTRRAPRRRAQIPGRCRCAVRGRREGRGERASERATHLQELKDLLRLGAAVRLGVVRERRPAVGRAGAHVLHPDSEVADVVLVAPSAQQLARALLQRLQKLAARPALGKVGLRPLQEAGAGVVSDSQTLCTCAQRTAATARVGRRPRMQPARCGRRCDAARQRGAGRRRADSSHQRASSARSPPPPCATADRPRFNGCTFSFVSSQEAMLRLDARSRCDRRPFESAAPKLRSCAAGRQWAECCPGSTASGTCGDESFFDGLAGQGCTGGAQG